MPSLTPPPLPPAPFRIQVFAEERRIEVVYPPQPTAVDVASYTLELRRAIDGMKGTWCIVVDQRQLKRMESDVQKTLSSLAAYAQTKGMRRGVRLVADAIANMQVWRLHKDAGLAIPTETFSEREPALEWLYAEPF